MSRFSHQMPAANASNARSRSALKQAATAGRVSGAPRRGLLGASTGARSGSGHHGRRALGWARALLAAACVVLVAPAVAQGATYTAIDAGDYHTCAITTAGTPVCWGYDDYGQTAIPPNLGSVTQITAGRFHTCAITTAGTPVCWGGNSEGQSTIPPNLGSVTQISAGHLHTCAITTAGTPACWGNNGGLQTTIPPNLGSVTQISAGGNHTCAVTSAGSAACWGYDATGQTTIPPNLGSVTQITAGAFHTCAITTAGSAACWGYNSDGQTTVPPNLGSVTQITGGRYHTCAITTAGTPACWGLNGGGQSTIPPNLGSLTQITAGYHHTCALKTDATAVCWGNNDYGQGLVPPHNTARPQITGTPKVGSSLAASTGAWNNAPTSFTYAWLRCTTNNTLATCTTIAGADQPSYAIVAADDTRYLRVVVTATNASGSVAQHSDPVKVTRVRPANTVRPTISGTPRVGSVLTATTGDWDNSPAGYAYAWQRCTTNNSLASCTPIAGADQSTYTLGAADDGAWIRVVVTATNSGGATSRHSSPTVQITWVRPDNTTRPVLTGTAQVGATLSTSTGSWDNVPDGYTYAWKRCTTIALASCTTIAGASLATYTLTAADAGTRIRAYVTATNSAGSATAYTYPSATVTSGA